MFILQWIELLPYKNYKSNKKTFKKILHLKENKQLR